MSLNKYSRHFGKQIAEKIAEKMKFQEEYSQEVKEFNLLKYLYGIKEKKNEV